MYVCIYVYRMYMYVYMYIECIYVCMNVCMYVCMYMYQRVGDSLCRDGADAQYMQYLRKSRITSPSIR